MALTAQQTGNVAATVRPLKRLLLLNPPDPVDLHFRLATALVDRSPDEAKRHVLQALEDAPRFRAAQKLLARLAKPKSEPKPKKTTPPGSQPNPEPVLKPSEEAKAE